MVGGVHGRGHMVGGHMWQRGMCGMGDMHGRGNVHGMGVCMTGGKCIRGHAWQKGA